MTITAEELGRIVTMDIDGLADYMSTLLNMDLLTSMGARMGSAATTGQEVTLSDEENCSLVRFMLITQRLVPMILEEMGETNEGIPTAQVQFEHVLNEASERSGKPVSELRLIFFPQEGA